MGMFDCIRCEVPLPDGWSGELQTKDFDCNMTTHVITAAGRLMLDNGRYEEVPKHERPYPHDDGLLGLRGSLRWIPRLEDANYHGIVNFYGLDDAPGSAWHEYNAKFTDGQLVEIVAAPDPDTLAIREIETPPGKDAIR